jgi:hypothetical protein
MMKKVFDPTETRKMLLGDVGYEWQLKRSLENSKHCGGLSSSANADLGKAIQCILVGLGDAASQLLEKAHKWATAALSSDKEIAGWLTFETLALCEWLLYDRHDQRLYQLLTDDLWRMATTPGVAEDAASVSLAMPSFVDAGDYERTLELFERTTQLVEPSSIDKIRNEAQLCLVIAQYRLGSGHSMAEVDEACDKFMLKNMDNWLRDGHSVRAAEWMKIIWGNRGGDTLAPNEIVLKCYDYLRGSHRPL